MEPAYPLVLTDQGHALVGEMVEIIELADHTMIETVGRLDEPAADRMKRSTDVKYSIATWSYAVKGCNKSPDVAKLVDLAVRERKEIAENRNDFVHSLSTGGYAARSISELEALRDRAASLSCLIAHIDHCMKSGDPSPWLERVRPNREAVQNAGR
jgi:hypothetical protein